MEYGNTLIDACTGLMNMKEPSLKTVDVNGTQLHYMVFGDNNKQSVIYTCRVHRLSRMAIPS